MEAIMLIEAVAIVILSLIGIIALAFYMSEPMDFLCMLFPNKVKFMIVEEKAYDYDTKNYVSTGDYLLCKKVLHKHETIDNTCEYKSLKYLIEEKDELEREWEVKKELKESKKPKYKYTKVEEDELTLIRLGDE